MRCWVEPGDRVPGRAAPYPDSDKTANKNLPVSTVAGNKFVLASAQAKALGEWLRAPDPA